MGYDFHALAAHVPLDEAMQALRTCLARLNLDLDKTGATHWSGCTLRVGEQQGWAVLFFDRSGIMPTLQCALSLVLDAPVMGCDACDIASYKHVSIVEAGEPTLLWTLFEAEVIEQQGIDRDALLAAFDATKRKVPKYMVEVRRDLDWEQLYGWFGALFHESIAGFNLESAALDTSESPEEEHYLIGDPSPHAVDLASGALWCARRGG